MSNTLDFNSVKKQYLTVILPDENNTRIMVTTPSKSLLEELSQIEHKFKDTGASEDSIDQTFGDLYDLIARVMSRNKDGVTVTKEDLEKCLDFEDIIIFFKSYIAFVKNIKSSKN